MTRGQIAWGSQFVEIAISLKRIADKLESIEVVDGAVLVDADTRTTIKGG